MRRQVAAAHDQRGKQVGAAIGRDHQSICPQAGAAGAGEVGLLDHQRQRQVVGDIPEAADAAFAQQDRPQQPVLPDGHEAMADASQQRALRPRRRHVHPAQSEHRRRRQQERRCVQGEEVRHRHDRGQQGHDARAHQPGRAVGGVEQGVGGGEQARAGQQHRQGCRQRWVEHGFPHRQHQDGHSQPGGGWAAGRQPPAHQQQQHGSAHEVRTQQRPYLVPTVGPSPRQQGRRQAARRLQCRQVAGGWAERADRHPDQRHGVKLVAHR